MAFYVEYSIFFYIKEEKAAKPRQLLLIKSSVYMQNRLQNISASGFIMEHGDKLSLTLFFTALG